LGSGARVVRMLEKLNPRTTPWRGEGRDRRLNSNSPTAYAQYEQGKRSPSLGKLRDLLHAIDPKLDAVLKAG